MTEASSIPHSFVKIYNHFMSKKLTFAALFSALICASSFIQIPFIAGIPLVLQDVLCIIAGIVLGPVYGTLSVLIFLFLGCLGLPVFSGKAGISVILQGPTGGFLIGYLVAAFVAGLILLFVWKKQNNIVLWIFVSIAVVISTIIIYAFGIFRFSVLFPANSFAENLTIVLIPFLPGTLVKSAIAIPFAKKILPTVKNYLE